jgi:hypothetical protein
MSQLRGTLSLCKLAILYAKDCDMIVISIPKANNRWVGQVHHRYLLLVETRAQ